MILTVPSHSLLPSLLSPSSHHHTLTITTLPSHNPTLAMEAIFPNKILTHDRGGLTTHRGGLTHDRGGLTHDRGGLTTNRGPLSLSPSVSMKSSIVITPLHIRQADSHHHHHKKVTNIHTHQSIYVSINYFLFFVLLITFTFILHGLSLSLSLLSYHTGHISEATDHISEATDHIIETTIATTASCTLLTPTRDISY